MERLVGWSATASLGRPADHKFKVSLAFPTVLLKDVFDWEESD